MASTTSTTPEPTTTPAPKGDAKAQEREAKRIALAAKKAEIAANAAAARAKVDAEHGHTTPPATPSATEPPAPSATPPAPSEGAVGAVAVTPSVPEATPKATTRERLEELGATAKTVKAFREGIAAIVADMAKPKPPKASTGNGNGTTNAKAAELEAAMLKAMAKATEAEPITLQDTMRALIPLGLVSGMTDARPYNAMKRMTADGRVTVAKATAPKAYFVTATK